MTQAMHKPQPDQLEGFPQVDAELLAQLPPVLKAVVKALGLVRARSFLSEHGGVNQNIPLNRSTALGLEDDELARLRHTLAPHMDDNGRVWMPKADRLLKMARDAQIRRDRGKESIKTLALRHNLSSRQITNIIREEDDRQFDLF